MSVAHVAVRLAAGAALIVLAGCASRPPALPADGPHPQPPPGLAQVPDAVPRVEPLRTGGPNKPYEVLGRSYRPMTVDAPLRETGLASWYGRRFHGRPTASGEIYDMHAMTAAHPTMPLPSYARVRNPANGREVIVRVNDRGPFVPGRIIDLSYTAALRLGLLSGVAPVEVARITHAEIRAGRWGDAAPQSPPPAVAPPTPPILLATAPEDGLPGDPPPLGPGYWLQLGAFREPELGRRRLQQLQADWDGPPLVLVVAEGWHRLQTGPWPQREHALAVADRLRRRGQDSLLLWREAPLQP